MASTTIGNYTWYLENAGQQAAITTLGAERIFGTGSLKCSRNGTAGRWWNCVRDAAPNAFQSGVGYCHFKIISLATGTQDRLGYYFLASQVDLSASGTLFAYVLEQVNGSGTWKLMRATSGGVSGLTTTLDTGATLSVADDDNFAVVVRWVYSAALGGIWVRGYYAAGDTLPDYSDTATPDVETIVSSSAPTSAGEGELVRGSIGSTGAYSFDRVGRFPYAVGAL